MTFNLKTFRITFNKLHWFLNHLQIQLNTPAEKLNQYPLLTAQGNTNAGLVTTGFCEPCSRLEIKTLKLTAINNASQIYFTFNQCVSMMCDMC